MTVRAEVLVPAGPLDAFRLFTDEIGLWWRTGTPYWNDPQRGVSVRIEPGVGGRFLEVYDADAGTGFEVGRVTAWEPGERLSFTWSEAGWPAGLSTTVEVTFAPVGEGTRVRLEHSGFEAVGEDAGAGYAAGWTEILGWMTQHVRGAA